MLATSGEEDDAQVFDKEDREVNCEEVEVETFGEEENKGGEGNIFLEHDKVSGGEYVVEGPPKKPGGICCVRAPNDKTISGEYVLARPPKTPGGICCVLAPNCIYRPPKKPGNLLLFVMLVSGVIDKVEGNSVEIESNFIWGM